MSETKTSFCAFPECSGRHNGSKTGLCRKHEEQLKFFIWALREVKVLPDKEPGRRPSGLILPT